MGLPHRVENFAAALPRPSLERRPLSFGLATPGERPQFHVDREGAFIREPVLLQRPTGPVFGRPAVETLERVDDVAIGDMPTRRKAGEPRFEVVELLLVGEGAAQRGRGRRADVSVEDGLQVVGEQMVLFLAFLDDDLLGDAAEGVQIALSARSE